MLLIQSWRQVIAESFYFMLSVLCHLLVHCSLRIVHYTLLKDVQFHVHLTSVRGHSLDPQSFALSNFMEVARPSGQKPSLKLDGDGATGVVCTARGFEI